MEHKSYSILNRENNSDAFYQNLGIFADIVVSKGYLKLGKPVDVYNAYIRRNDNNSKFASRDELILELIMIGVFWRNYMSRAAKVSSVSL